MSVFIFKGNKVTNELNIQKIFNRVSRWEIILFWFSNIDGELPGSVVVPGWSIESYDNHLILPLVTVGFNATTIVLYCFRGGRTLCGDFCAANSNLKNNSLYPAEQSGKYFWRANQNLICMQTPWNFLVDQPSFSK